MGEARGWHIGLERPLNEARPFYVVIALAILLGVGLGFTPLNPIKALLRSAVVNGVIVVPIMTAMMIMASRRRLMGRFTASRWQVVLGWAATAVMTAAAVGMFATM